MGHSLRCVRNLGAMEVPISKWFLSGEQIKGVIRKTKWNIPLNVPPPLLLIIFKSSYNWFKIGADGGGEGGKRASRGLASSFLIYLSLAHDGKLRNLLKIASFDEDKWPVFFPEF